MAKKVRWLSTSRFVAQSSCLSNRPSTFLQRLAYVLLLPPPPALFFPLESCSCLLPSHSSTPTESCSLSCCVVSPLSYCCQQHSGLLASREREREGSTGGHVAVWVLEQVTHDVPYPVPCAM